MEPVLVERDGSLAVVTLNRPARMNAVNDALRGELIAALGRLNADTSVRAVVLTGAGGRAFCAGQDLDEAAAVTWQQIVPWLNRQRAMYQAVRDLDKPCVAAVQGVAAGAGFQLALCADWRLTTPDSRWGQPEVKAGLASIVGSYLMTLHVGHTHNVQMSLSGELVSGQRAYEIGLVTALHAEAELMDAALARARSLASLPPTSVRLSKQRLRAMTQPGFDDACVAGIRAQLECYADGEPQRVMAEFLSQRNAKEKQ
ncbi:enoyl-CoA hydratase/isomerase family protein [Cupriavidus pauculus]|jgi:enoyl-CoA hydratase/carnithine racemase|uniref:enoyl-CoA hydratase/isomerase family protein n=1 Tax=Cupriavidus pauculus TaxID=82633 RepID=UPI000780A77F|nr:enoyl-CoA hydratase/isomerase family protein [Cupriavidus pauculus]KAB0605314.1 enoyl-CoA hydratase/isomerase family protein [Cupriavidus pauculus]MBY4729053.1 enoyl-CoA hydratase/isomerase family protein [Cupriavidus pauculus]MCM3605225.1 enoyl-CoA hydratase/isomerase family protein [Cupriavidus pauculus]UAK99678.1 enoyl-CoA hydratase/isomerase family protein [Cupriavidus pauculus]